MADKKITDVVHTSGLTSSDSIFVNQDNKLKQIYWENIQHAQIKLLWSNPDYTQAFNEATLDIDLSGYSFIIIFFRCSTSISGTIASIALKGYESRGIVIPGGGGSIFSRSFYPQTTGGISIYSGYEGTTLNQKACIPIRIFGVKGVIY